MVEAFSRNASYDVTSYVEFMRSTYLLKNQKLEFACGSEAKHIINLDNPDTRLHLPERGIIAYCMDPLPANAAMLQNMMDSMSYDRNQIIISHAAAGG